MRVLHLHSGNLFGGTETLLLTLARQRGEGTEPRSEFGLCFEGRLASHLREEGVDPAIFGEVTARRPLTVWRARKALQRHLEDRTFDAVICHSPWILAVLGPAVRRAGVPLALWLHDGIRERHWIHLWARRTPPDLVICNSRYTEGTLPLLFANVPSAVLYCPVEPPRSVPHPERARIRAELATPEGAVVLIQVGRMEPFKGYLAHLEGLARASVATPALVSWIVGGAQRPEEARYLAELQLRAAELGITERVRFLGYRDEVEPLLAAADVYCQPNVLPEPFGIAIVEALYAGLPVITTAFGGAAEIVTPDCGVLVPPSDTGALADAMRRLAESDVLRKSLAAAGPARAAAISDPRRVLAELAAIVERLVPPPESAVAHVGAGDDLHEEPT